VNSYGMRVQVQTGCKVSYSGQCTWSVGLTVTF
jgi:hypothetical protein